MSDMGRRSNRSRKAVDYTKLDCVGTDDDDFQDSSPPTKRQKHKIEGATKKREKKQKNEVLKEIQTNSCAVETRKERVPVTEKVFERHLQAALELSTTSDTQGAELRKEPEGVEVIREKDLEPLFETDLEIVSSKSNGRLPQEQMDSEENSDRDLESDPSDWSDAENSKRKMKAKEKTVGKGKKPEEKQKIVKVTQTKVHQERTVTTKLLPSVSLLGGTGRTPNTGLRLGLSKKVASKPLHPVVKAQH